MGQTDRKRLTHHRLGRSGCAGGQGWMGTGGCGERRGAGGKARCRRKGAVLTGGRGRGAAEQRAAQHGHGDTTGARRANSRQTTGPPSAPRALIGQRRARCAAPASSDWAVRWREGPSGRARRLFPRPRREGGARSAAARARGGGQLQQWRPAPSPSWPTRAMASRSWMPTPPSWSWTKVSPRGLGAVAGLGSGAGVGAWLGTALSAAGGGGRTWSWRYLR